MSSPGLIHTFAPTFDVRSSHQILVKADPTDTFHALLTINFSEVPIIRFLMWARGYGKKVQQKPEQSSLMERMKESSFQELAFVPSQEVVLGIVGRFWRPDGCLVKLDTPEQFLSFSQSGFAKGAWSISVEPGAPGETWLRTETRVICLGTAARRKFRAYWFFVGPFSGLIRTAMLRQVKRTTESSVATAASLPT